MASCIHPACSCKAYQEPKRVKGTLLQLRMGCQGCSHHASDHRQLTAVDQLMEREVTAAAGNKCTHLIPVTEIPLSPVFGPHDLIPVPFDDASDKGCGVPCACTGFQVTAIVRLWQKFRTYSMNDALLAIPQITCSFCQHPLLNHQEVLENSKSLVVTTFEKGVSNLTLKSAAKIGFAPVNGSCVQFIPPKDTKGNLMFVALTESDPPGSSLELRLHSYPLCWQEKQEEGDERGREKGKEEEGKGGEVANEESPVAKKSDDHSTEQLCTHESASIAISTSVSEGQNLRISPQPLPQNAIADLTVDGKVSNSVAGKESVESPKKRGRKRKQTTAMSTGQRKSARIAAKKQNTAVVPSKKRSLNVTFQLKDISLGRTGLQPGSMNGRPAALDCQKAAEDPSLRESVAKFVEMLKKKESFTSHKLPESISTAGLEVMAATGCCQDPATGKSTLLVALGSGAGETYVWTPVNGLQVTPLKPSCTVQSLSWQELSPASSEAATGTYLCIGGSRGTLHIWHVQLLGDSQRIQCQVYPIEGKVDVPTRADIVACSWAPNGKFLAVGSLLGEVLVYTFPSCEHLQTLHCCRAPVTCFAWSTDCSMLAVGGSDDCVQVLQRGSSPSIQTHPRNSILNYMKVDPKSRKYIHTHSFIGHQSFVGSLAFLSSGASTNTLVSIGWDSQILFWQIQSSHASLANTRLRGHSRNHPNLPFVDTEPQCGYKVGPSASVEFLPIALHTVPGGGVIVMLMDKLGAVTIANYHFTLLS